ncbi:MAG: 50S ribosomal protein L22 [Fimbriimonadales bacterium]
MEVRAIGRNFRVQPRKVRIVAQEIKGKHAVEATGMLAYHTSKSARLLNKVLRSAVANAVNNHEISADTLVVRKIQVDEGYRLKRIDARSMGRANRIHKRTSHITVVLEEGDGFKFNRSNAKPKPRPKLEWPKAKKEVKAKEEVAVEETVETTEVTDAVGAAEPTEVSEESKES